MRKLQRFIVNIPRNIHNTLLRQGELREIHQGIFVQANDGLYHPKLGLCADDPAFHDPESLIV